MVCATCQIVPGEAGRKIEPPKMVATTTKSIAEEIIDAIKDKTYNSCVSNLTKTHCVNLKTSGEKDCQMVHGLL